MLCKLQGTRSKLTPRGAAGRGVVKEPARVVRSPPALEKATSSGVDARGSAAMSLLCFLLDLRNIPPPLLHRLKEVRYLPPHARPPAHALPLLRGSAAFLSAELSSQPYNHVLFPARVLQCLLDLANLYAATTSQTHAVTASPAAAGTLPDRLALGYVYDPSSKPSSSCSSSCPEVRIQYPSLPAADLFV